MTKLSPRILAGLVCVLASWPAFGEVRTTTWRDGAGEWADTTRWSAGLPDGLARGELAGRSRVRLAKGQAVTGGLQVGAGRGDDVRLELAGGQLVVRRNFIRIGEEDGGVAQIVQEAGALHCPSATYIGGANGTPGRACRGTLRIRGGSFVSRVVTLGWGCGSEALLAIEGSRADAVHVLDYITLGAYEPCQPSDCTLAFTLDARGVTPITIQSSSGGLTLERKKVANHCRLRIELSAIPPRDDVTLIAAKALTRGEFDGLPEGSEIVADWKGRTFRWKLTYRGGSSGCDLMLRDVKGHLVDEVVSALRARPDVPEFLWLKIPLREPLPVTFEPAFAGAEGFGAIARGGRDGREIEVVKLDDSGPGSLRAAIETKGPRVIVFKVGGTIRLKTPLVVREPFVSILGQTASDDGIELRGSGLAVRTHDVVLRYLRIRPGHESNGEDAIEFYDAERCIADHCSFTWGDDETCSIVGLSDAITIQHCLIAEGLNHANHSMAGIAGGERTTWHHNLIAHCRTRNPRFAGSAWCDFRNNVIYNWGDVAAYGDFERLNYVANWLQPGPSTKQQPPLYYSDRSVLPPRSFFAHGNWMNSAAADWTAIECEKTARADEPFAAPSVTTDTAETALRQIDDQAGVTLPRRDATDARIVNDVRQRTGRIIDRTPDSH